MAHSHSIKRALSFSHSLDQALSLSLSLSLSLTHSLDQALSLSLTHSIKRSLSLSAQAIAVVRLGVQLLTNRAPTCINTLLGTYYLPQVFHKRPRLCDVISLPGVQPAILLPLAYR